MSIIFDLTLITYDDIEELKAKRICYHCVNEPFLKNEVRKSGKRLKCSYCENVDRAYKLGIMASIIENAFERHYQPTATQPNYLQEAMLRDKESSYYWERDGEKTKDAIEMAADIPEQAASDIQQILEFKYYDYEGIEEETAFDEETCYEPKGFNDDFWQEQWRQFEESLITEARFFNQTGLAHLKTIFSDIDNLRTQDNRSVFVDAGPNTLISELYRARVFQADNTLEEALKWPDKQLGPPPSFLAIAGRMNAKGISVFYGANNVDVALAEVRPPVGSQVAVARFEIIKHLRLLDLSALSVIAAPGSIFDETYAGRIEKATFLRNLSVRLTKPIMPNDEAFEYLTTQAIADFLASEVELNLDGIIFPSAQVPGTSLNIVLFHKASLVEDLNIPQGTEITASLGEYDADGWQTWYSVVEKLPKKIDENIKPDREDDFKLLFGEDWMPLETTSREPSLKIDIESIFIHQIKSVVFTYEKFPVSRYRTNKSEWVNIKDE